MSIELAEQLKRDLTDKWVLVDKTIPELKRFAGLTGKVKTVNMSARALVEFDGPADIGWYDIDPSFLTVVDEPVKKEKAAEPAKAEKKPAAAKPAGGGSPLDAIRSQGAGGAAATPKKASPLDAIRKQGAGGASAPAAETPASKPAAGGSPLDMIRNQGAAGAASAPTEETAEETAPADEPAAQEPEAEAPAPEAATASSEDLSGLSPVEQIRRQGAFKG